MTRPVIRAYEAPRKLTEIPFGSCFECGHLVEPNSGWRTFRPVIDQKACKGCLQCYLLCPDGVIYEEGEAMLIDYDFCKGCGICAAECKFGAISMEKEEL